MRFNDPEIGASLEPGDEEIDPLIPYDQELAEGDDIIRWSDFAAVARAGGIPEHRLLHYRSPLVVFWGLYFIVLCLLASLLYWYSSFAPFLAASRAQVFDHYEFWRLGTAVLVHADIGHLLSNSLLFLFFSWHLQSYGGAWLFPGLASLSGILTHGLSLWTYPNEVRLVGASGMVYAMVGLWLMIYLVRETRYRLRLKLLRVFGFSLVVLMPTSLVAEVSYRAHGIGLLVGIGFGIGFLLLERRLTSRWRESASDVS